MESHADLFADTDGVLVAPFVVLLELVHEHLHLLLVLAHTFSLNRILHINLLLAKSHLSDTALMSLTVGALPQQLSFVARGRLDGHLFGLTFQELWGAGLHRNLLLQLLLMGTHLEIQIGVIPE